MECVNRQICLLWAEELVEGEVLVLHTILKMHWYTQK